MVIGNGMIANVFAEFKSNDDVIIFASGVANSKETNPLEFEKEFLLIEAVIKNYPNESLLVYFSTCSINNDFSPYTKHKLIIENYIKQKCDKYLILRLPLVVGKSQNKNQLLGHLFSKVRLNQEVQIYRRATRYFIDSNDLPKILKYLIFHQIENKVIDVALDNEILVSDLIEIIERVTGKKFLDKKYLDKESIYIVKNEWFLDFMDKNPSLCLTYEVEQMIKKYFSDEIL